MSIPVVLVVLKAAAGIDVHADGACGVGSLRRQKERIGNDVKKSERNTFTHTHTHTHTHIHTPTHARTHAHTQHKQHEKER